MKSNGRSPWGKIASVFALFGLVLALSACQNPALDDPTQDDPNVSEGSISGRVSFANPESSGTITVFLEKTDGLNIEPATPRDFGRARTVGSGTRSTVADADGFYVFDGIPGGIYTIHAVSEGESERAILVNISVEENSQTNVADMTLRPTGNITGKVMLEGSENNNLGFTVFIAGTSFSAITDSSGRFTISNVPADTVFQIAVMRGIFVTIWTDALVQSDGTNDLGNFDVTHAQLQGDAIIWRGALSAPPENPQRNWSYFNTTTRRTYVFDGTQWIVVGQVLTTSNVVYRSNGHTGGIPPVDPNPDGGYVFGATVYVMEPGTLVRDGYRFGGWSRDAAIGGVIYQPGERFTMGANPVVFYAVWLRLFTVSFDGNDHTDGTVPKPMQGVTGETLELADSLERTGYRFVGWSPDRNATSGEFVFIVESSHVTLYAVWGRPPVGILSLTIDVPSGRTILPDITWDDCVRFELEFFARDAGNTDSVLSWAERSGSIKLDVGTWDLHVTAFLGRNGSEVVGAVGSLYGILVNPGETVVRNVEIFLVTSGQGTFSWDINFEVNIDTARMEIISLDENGSQHLSQIVYLVVDGEPIPHENPGHRDLYAGQYRVILTLDDARENRAVLSAILHIYANLVSHFEITITQEFFPVTLLDFVLSAWDGSQWNFAEMGITAGHFPLLGINGIEAANFNDIVHWFYVLCSAPCASAPIDLHGLKTLVDASLIGIARDSLGISNYPNRAYAEMVIVELAVNHSEVRFEWTEDGTVAIVWVGVYRVEITFGNAVLP